MSSCASSARWPTAAVRRGNFARLGSSLIRHTKLDSRLRELLILHLSVELGASYEWFEHEPVAREAGVSEAELDAPRAGQLTDAAFDDRDRAVLGFGVAVVEQRVDDDTWAAMLEYLDVEELTDLVVAACWWGAMVPRLVDALGIEPPSTEP